MVVGHRCAQVRPRFGTHIVSLMSQGLPNWTRDELILAVDVYLRLGESLPQKDHPEVLALSELLRRLNIHDPIPTDPRFRNPAGVYRKLADIHTASPDYTGRPTKGSHLDGVVLAAFKADPERYRCAAATIREGAAGPVGPVPDVDETEGEEEPSEGRLLLARHYRRERNAAKVAGKKAKVLREVGRLECEACGFDFAATYGERGEGFIECHHRVPLAESGPTQTRLSDLALVCSNCHRMIHRSSQWLTVDDLRTQIRSARD